MARTPKLIDQVRAAVLNDGWVIDRSYRSSRYEAYGKPGQGFIFISKSSRMLRGDTIANSLPMNPQQYIKRVYERVSV